MGDTTTYPVRPLAQTGSGHSTLSLTIVMMIAASFDLCDLGCRRLSPIRKDSSLILSSCWCIFYLKS